MNANEPAPAQGGAPVQDRPSSRPRRNTIEPYQLLVPSPEDDDMARLVGLVAARLGQTADEVREVVEKVVLRRGLDAVLAEEGVR